MKQMKFTSNIKCAGCIAKITPHLKAEKRIVSWDVDIADPQKTLTVQADHLSAEELQALVAAAGFRAQAAE